MLEKEVFDLAIIGLGPAGITAGIYAARYKIKTIAFDPVPGGLMNEAHLIGNYPGFTSITGIDLVKHFVDHLKNYDLNIVQEEIAFISKENNLFKIISKSGNIFYSKSLILALGLKHRKLNISGEEKFAKGKGVSYCYTCDGPLFKDKVVAVIGGSDSACLAALFLSKYAKKVFIIYRKNKLRGEPINVESILSNKKVEVIYNTNVIELFGKSFLEKIKLDNAFNESNELFVEGLFVEIGSVPSLNLINQLGLKVNESNLIECNEMQCTSIKGVFAVGDLTNNIKLRQIVVAAAQGAIASFSAYKFLQENNLKK